MDDVYHGLIIIVNAVFVQNVILNRILGLCPFLGSSQRLEQAWGIGAATSFVLTIGCALSHIIYYQLLIPLNLSFLKIISFIFVIAATVQLAEIVVRYVSERLYALMGIYLPLITTNCAVLGVPLLSLSKELNFLQAMCFGFGSAVGFTIVLVILAGLRERFVGANIPVPFRGAPITLMSVAVMSLVFSSFVGLL